MNTFKLKKALLRPIFRLGDVWWKLKFKMLCKYYGGGPNIPADALRRWCPLNMSYTESACFAAAEHIVAMERFFGLTPKEDIAMIYFSGFMYGTSATLYDDIVGQRIALSSFPAKQYFRCLYIHSDYQRKIKYILSQPDKLTEFRELLNRQNKHLTLTMDV